MDKQKRGWVAKFVPAQRTGDETANHVEDVSNALEAQGYEIMGRDAEQRGDQGLSFYIHARLKVEEAGEVEVVPLPAGLVEKLSEAVAVVRSQMEAANYSSAADKVIRTVLEQLTDRSSGSIQKEAPKIVRDMVKGLPANVLVTIASEVEKEGLDHTASCPGLTCPIRDVCKVAAETLRQTAQLNLQ